VGAGVAEGEFLEGGCGEAAPALYAFIRLGRNIILCNNNVDMSNVQCIARVSRNILGVAFTVE